ncbi:hypothetical protein [Kribbella yunnanensis]
MDDRRVDVIQSAYPLALGYMRRYPLMRVDEVARTQEGLASYARRNGFTLGTVHVEDLLTDPQAFLEMVAAINLFEIPAVVIPTAAHLGNPVVPESKRAYFDRETKARVLVADLPGSPATRTGMSEVP